MCAVCRRCCAWPGAQRNAERKESPWLRNIFGDVLVTTDEIGIRKIGVNDLWQSLKEGYDDFNAKPSFGVVLLASSFRCSPCSRRCILVGKHHAPSDLSGGRGLYASRSRGLGRPLRNEPTSRRWSDVSWRSAFDLSTLPRLRQSSRCRSNDAALRCMAVHGEVPLRGSVRCDPPVSVADFVTQLVTTRRGHGLIFYGSGLGFMFAFMALAISVVGFPLLLDKPVSSITAVHVRSGRSLPI